MLFSQEGSFWTQSMVKFKMASLPALPPNRKCSIFPTVIDWFSLISQEWVSRDVQCRSSWKWLHILLSCQTESASIFLHLTDRFVPFSQERGFLGCPERWWRLKCENATNPSVTGRKILNFTIAFSIPRNPLPEKTAWINLYMTGKCWHFLFGPFWRFEVLPLYPSARKKGSHILIGSSFV